MNLYSNPLFIISISLLSIMCKFRTRVFACGYYKKSLKISYDLTKEKKVVCDSGSEDSNITGTWCYQDGCDKKAGILREGLG